MAIHTHQFSANKYDGVREINLENGASEIEGRSRFGEIFIDKNRVELLVQGFIEKTVSFETIDLFY